MRLSRALKYIQGKSCATKAKGKDAYESCKPENYLKRSKEVMGAQQRQKDEAKQKEIIEAQ